MKKFIVFFCICINCFFIGCNKIGINKDKEKGSKNNSTIVVYADSSVEPMVKCILKNFNMNKKNKIQFKIIPQKEIKDKMDKKSLFIGYDVKKQEKYNVEPIAKEAIAIVVNEKCPLENITVERIRDIYKGDIKNFQDMNTLKKESGKINYLDLKEDNNLKKNFEEKILNIPFKIKQGKDVEEVNSIDEIIKRLQEEGYIGYLNMQNITKGIKILKVDGVEYSKNSIESGAYKLSYDINLIYNEDVDEKLEEFVSYIKSDEAKKIISNYCIGY